MVALLNDLRFAARSLQKSPGLIAVATLSLALGIAVNVTIFTGIDFVIWHPVSLPVQEQLMQVWSANKERGWSQASVSMPDYLDWRAEAKTIELTAYRGSAFNLSEGDGPERIDATEVTANFFRVLGIAPSHGRSFTETEETTGGNRVALISERLWLDRFAGRSEIIGHPIGLDGEPYVIVGVVPARFKLPQQRSDVWVPARHDGKENRGDHNYRAIGRLVAGFSQDQAQTELDRIAHRLADRYPSTNKGTTTRVITLLDEVVDPTARQAGVISLVAVGFVLLIGCANVANLLLTRGAARSREIAVRAAMGASRGRILGQLLTESLVLAVIGGATGVILSFAGIQWLRSIIPTDAPGVEQVAMSGRALLFALAATVFAGFVFGILPALRATAPDLTGALRDGGRGGTAGVRHGRLRNAFVIGELALALVLLISAGLLIKASFQLQRIDLGFKPDGLLTFRTALSEKDYPDSTRVVAFQDQLTERLRALPAVKAAGAVSQLPLIGRSGIYYAVVGEPEPEEGKWPVALYRTVSPGYFDAIGMRLLSGRDVEPTDRFDAPPVMLVNEAFVQRHWPAGRGLSHRIRFQSGATREIVGVVNDTREFGPDDPSPPMMYFASPQSEQRAMSFVVRAGSDPGALASAVRQAVSSLAPRQPVYAMETMPELIRLETQNQSIMPKLLGVFGAIALLLAVMGVYGVMAYSVSQRTQELGVRRALGAQAGDLIRLVFRLGGKLTLIGSVIGVGLAALSSRALARFLFGVSAFDPAVFGGVTLTLAGAALAASFAPAWRATRVDPLVALRND
ncbi:MAG: ABC transporter permease [Gemmatimonadota bacterium]